eukprot:8404870-Prorocentrum_lima.AAC.1
MVEKTTADSKEKADNKKPLPIVGPVHGSTATGGGSSNDVPMSDGQTGMVLINPNNTNSQGSHFEAA